MTIDMKKIWFVDGAIIEKTIPEAEIYNPNWGIDYCKSYAEQLRDKTRANRAEHAAECIEYLLSLVQKEWVGLTDHETEQIVDAYWNDPAMFVDAIEAKLKEKNNAD